MLDFLLDKLISLVGSDYVNKREKDKNLLALLLQSLPTDSSGVLFLKEHDMGDPVPFSHLQPLNAIRSAWLAPGKEFFTRKRVKLKCDLVFKLNFFLITQNDQPTQ